MKKKKKKPTLLWTNKIDRDYLTCALKKIPHDLMAKTETRTNKRKNNTRQLTIDRPILQIAIILRNHVIRSIDWYHPVCAKKKKRRKTTNDNAHRVNGQKLDGNGIEHRLVWFKSLRK